MDWSGAAQFVNEIGVTLTVVIGVLASVVGLFWYTLPAMFKWLESRNK